MEKKIIKNRIRCRKCGDVITSRWVHDFRYCSCKACGVDGGTEYLRRIGELEDWEDLSIVLYENDDPIINAKKITEQIIRGQLPIQALRTELRCLNLEELGYIENLLLKELKKFEGNGE